jgi:hypothetical protein
MKSGRVESRSFAGKLASLMVSSPAPFPVIGWSPIPISSVALRCIPRPVLPLAGGRGLPSCPTPLSLRAVPLPRRTPNVSSRRTSGFNISGRLAILLCVTRPSRVRDFSLQLAGSLCAASTRRSSAALCASLHAGRSVDMVNTFQFTSWVGGVGCTRLHRFTQIEKSGGELFEFLKLGRPNA